MNNEFRRKVVQVTISDREHSGFNGRGFSWRVDRVQTAVAECGHKREYRGWCQRVPKTFSPCKECAAGASPLVIEGSLGVIDESSGQIRDPIAAAIIQRATEGL